MTSNDINESNGIETNNTINTPRVMLIRVIPIRVMCL
ncbi:hypothetical protein ZOSMA_30G01230 [Zostera marina]|uniref:Uncharacterized protein n=1 Tax=Zostera marina TaxID=29655 RepID=A0A0K9PC73_ZOSMR|nr:hypothetical protein ZOSMA_30G01230 [Zostera marina]